MEVSHRSDDIPALLLAVKAKNKQTTRVCLSEVSVLLCLEQILHRTLTCSRKHSFKHVRQSVYTGRLTENGNTQFFLLQNNLCNEHIKF